jgi:CheY-like chemotaxis protein
MAHPETPVSKVAPVVLVIDDDHSFCVFMAKLIRSLGYEVMTTTEPTTTSLYQLSETDIVFIDIMMPAMDGFEVLKTLSSQGAKCSIVLMSGSDDRLGRAETMARQLGLRLIGVLHKPFRLADLQGVLGAER